MAAEKKTTPNEVDPVEFVAGIEHAVRRGDAETMLDILGSITGYTPKMWGPSIVGFGRYEYKYESGREGESMIVGFSPRKANTVVYLMPGYEDLTEPLSRLGKHKIGKSCLYLNKLEDIDQEVLEEIVKTSVDKMHATHPTFPE